MFSPLISSRPPTKNRNYRYSHRFETLSSPRTSTTRSSSPVNHLLIASAPPFIVVSLACPALPREGRLGLALRAFKGEAGKWHPRRTQNYPTHLAKRTRKART